MAKSLNPNMPTVLSILAPLMLLLAQSSMAEQCGRQAGGAMCPGGACCSQFGWCGTTQNYCGAGCQSQCSGSPSPIPPSPGGGVSSIITQGVFNNMLKHKDDGNCEGKGFYTYNAFITAANAFNGFGTTGSTETRKRELAAFFAQTSHETTGGWDTAPDGRYAWGYCYKTERNHADYCQRTATWGCAGGKQYYGRGPIQLTWNYNYGQAGRAIGFDGINDPDIVARDPVVSFKTAVWFWMTAQSPKPSCHDVMTGRWGGDGPRQPGFGVTTNIINGGLECGKGSVPQQNDRIGFYKRYCDLLGVSYGNNLDCNGQPPFTALTSEVKQQAESSLIRTVV